MTTFGPRRRCFGAVLLAALFLAGSAPAATLEGRLLAADSHRPVDGARVRVLETGQAQLTDAYGRFAFRSLPAGLYTLSVHHVAYADVERCVRIADDLAAPVQLEAPPALYATDEIVVRSSRSTAAIRSQPCAVEVVPHDRLCGAPAPTLSDALAGLPGVALARDGTWATAVSVRGLGRSNVVALVDNTRIETATDLAAGLSLVNREDVERVEVMKSSGSVLFGSGATGGVVQVVTRRAAFSDRPRSGVEWTNGFSSSGSGHSHYVAAEHTTSRQALRLSAGYRKAGDVQTPRGILANSRFNDWSLNGSLGVRTVGRQSLTASYQRVQAEDTGLPGGAPFSATAIAEYTLARRELVALEYAIPNPFSRVPLLTARASRQQIARNVSVIQGPAIRLTPHAVHTTTSGVVEARFVPGHEHLVIAGAELMHRAVDSRRERWLPAQNRVLGERPIPPAACTSGGVYAQDEWRAVPGRVRVVAGARYDRSRTRNDLALNPVYAIDAGVYTPAPSGQTVLWPGRVVRDRSWSANAGVHVDLNAACGWSVLAATAFRSPSLEERYQYLDLGSSLHVGNPALAPERSRSLNLGAHLGTDRTRLQADAFANRLRGLVAEVPGTYEGRAAFVKANIGEAVLYGWEVSADQRVLAHVALRASLSYVRGEDTRAHANLSQIAPLGGTGELAFEAPRAGTLRLTATAAHGQGNPGPGESPTAGWTSWGASVAGLPLRVRAAVFEFQAGVDNVFDRAYRLHLATLRGLVQLEPGTNAFVAATVRY